MAFLIQNVFLFKVHLIISNCHILVNISAQKCSDLVESSTFCTLLKYAKTPVHDLKGNGPSASVACISLVSIGKEKCM